jgi:hypothetical protein
MLRDQTRLRKALAEDRTRWAQRLHALLTHEGWPCQRARLLTVEGRRWVQSLSLSPPARAQVDRLLRLIEAVEEELRSLETELRRFARADRRCLALQTIYGVGPILACHLLAELGEAARFRRARRRSAPPDSIRSSTSRVTRDAVGGWPSTAHPFSVGRWSKRPSTPSAPIVPTAACTRRPQRASAASARCLPSRARSAVAPTTSCVNSRHKRPERTSRPVTIVRDTKAPPHGNVRRALPLSTDSAHSPVLDWNEPRQPRSDLPRRTASADIGMGHQPRTHTLRSPPPRTDTTGPSHIGPK